MGAQLDAWLRAQPGRCPVCGFHPPTQGHRGSCSVLHAEKRFAR